MPGTTTLACQRALEAVHGYLLLDMPEQALRELSAIRGIAEDSALWQRLRGEALRSRQQHADALQAFEWADRIEPDELSTLLGIAWCQKRVDRLDDAIETMLRAYRACPKEPIVLYNIACYYALAGDKGQALSWLGRALRMSPDLRRLVPEETDFDPLRHDADFQFVIEDPRERDIC
ncbi:MAG: hypothetical protein AB7U20_11325 [Planctomycetaceae bacterium]